MRQLLDKYRAHNKRTVICDFCGKERRKDQIKRHMREFCPDRPNKNKSDAKKPKK